MKNNIGILRKQKGLSMQELAELAGTSQQQIDRLEKGQRRLTADWMQTLSTALGCKPGDLVDFDAPSENKPTAPTKIETAVARVIGAIETHFSNKVRKLAENEQYDISFLPSKKDSGKKFFALSVEGGPFRNYPENSQLIFAQVRSSALTASLHENEGEFISGNAKPGTKPGNEKFEIGDKLIEGYLVKSIRSE